MRVEAVCAVRCIVLELVVAPPPWIAVSLLMIEFSGHRDVWVEMWTPVGLWTITLGGRADGGSCVRGDRR